MNDKNENLDKRIHEALWPERCWHESSDTDRATVRCEKCGNSFGSGLWEDANRKYSTDISDAWKVVERLREMGYVWELRGDLADYPDLVQATFAKGDGNGGERHFTTTADTLPQAICLAAEKVINGERNEREAERGT